MIKQTLSKGTGIMDTLTQAIAEYNANNPLPEYPQSRLTKDQLGHVVGSVPLDIVDGLRDALRSDGESVEAYRVGAPLGGTADPRRRFKREELQDLVTFRQRQAL